MAFDEKLQRVYRQRREEAWLKSRMIEGIPSLQDDFSEVRHCVVSSEEGIEALVGDAQVILMTGGYFGDEAKGKWGNALATKVDMVVRPNSGANTGRTICYKAEKLSLHLVPTGLLEGIRAIIGSETVGDPISLDEEELALFRAREIDYSLLEVGNFFITTPYHRIMDVLGSALNGSTGVGIMPTHKSIKGKSCPRLDDLFNSSTHLRRVLSKDHENYEGFLETKLLNRDMVVERLLEIQQRNRRIVPEYVLEFAKSREPIEFLNELYAERVVRNIHFPKRVDASYEVKRALQRGERVLLEVTQSYLLSNARQQGYRYSTSADVTALGALTSLGISPMRYSTRVINVNKFPGASRVGPGDIPGSFVAQNHFAENKITSLSELGEACVDFNAICQMYFSAIGKNGILQPVTYTDATGTYEIGEAMAIANARTFDERGATTGKPRITGLFDCVLGRLVAEEQGPYTVISCMDRGNVCDKVGLVVGYVVSLPEEVERIDCNGMMYTTGKVIVPGDQVPTSDVLQYCVPIIRVMEGWKSTPLGNLHPGEELPLAVSSVIGAIEKYTGFLVMAIGTGPETNEALYLKR